ncbi:MAG: laccase domain-containing protein [Verrucomicrobia bacterium]|nr:laccase domain-containing protein [Verrucomicrobiota bacterium]
MTFLRFPELEARGLLHAFTLRSVPPLISVDVPQILEEAGLPKDYGIGEQTHGVGVAIVNQGGKGKVIPAVDALITREKNLSLVIRVADCGPVWIHCEKTSAIGLVHSGRKGTEAGVVGATIRRMREEFGSEPSSMLALLGPCIRPPHYEVNFAGEILRQLEREKVGKVVDSGLCTASDLTRFYSYRAEKGQTGRHFGIVSL